MSEALQALFTGDVAQADASLAPDDELSVFDAAAFGRVKRLRELLDSDTALVNAMSEDGFSGLHLAIFGRQAQAAQILIDAGADLNRRSTGPIAQVPPLGTAAFVRSVPLTQLLLDAGADVNGCAQDGFTALHTAAQNGDLELARALLARSANPNAQTVDGRTPSQLTANTQLRALLAPTGSR